MDCTTEHAAIILSSTYSASQDRPRSTCRDGTCTTRALIGALPTELLLIIFKLVYMKSRVPKDYIDLYDMMLPPDSDFPYETIWATDQNLLCPSLFPYALASVCSTWRDVMSTVPVFWTRVVILVDSNPTPLLVIKSYLHWSRDLPLHVTVTRQPGTFEGEDSDEKLRVAAVMELLGPHVHRCHSLQFDVIYCSSLPSIRRDFYGVASGLEKLQLKCRVDDGRSDLSDPVEHKAFSCPILTKLVIDCRNFMDTCIIDAHLFKNVTSLHILHFSPSESAGEAPSLYRVLETLQNYRGLSALTLSNIEFDFSPGSYGASSFKLFPEEVTFEGLSSEVLGEFFHVTDATLEFATIRRCSIDTFYNFSSLHLSLYEIDQDFGEFLSEWDGRYLYLKQCPGFDDNVLARMGEAPLGGYLGAPNMDNLSISDCLNFSVGALREMVDARCRMATTYEDGDDWNDDPSTPCRMKGLAVNCCGPLISSQDSAWFQANLDYFQWHTTLPDGRMCHNGVVSSA